MQKQPKRYRGFIAHGREDEAKARRLHRALERYRVPRGIASGGQSRKLGRFFCDGDENGAAPALALGEALKGALADSECLITICSPQAVASELVEREIIHFKTISVDEPLLAVIVKGKPHASASPNPRKAARECLPAALANEVDPDGAVTEHADEFFAAPLRKESLARTRARIAATLLDVPFDQMWRHDRGRAWTKGLFFGVGALCFAGALAFGALAVTGLAMRNAKEGHVLSASETAVNVDAATATVVACSASVESVRAWDAALEVGMRANEYREMEKLGSAFKEVMYVCAATAGRRSTEQNARALCDRMDAMTAPEIPRNATPTYEEAMGLMSEQLEAVHASCAKRLKAGAG